MPIYKGNKEITAIYKGDKPISAIYKGDTLIFSSGTWEEYLYEFIYNSLVPTTINSKQVKNKARVEKVYGNSVVENQLIRLNGYIYTGHGTITGTPTETEKSWLVNSDRTNIILYFQSPGSTFSTLPIIANHRYLVRFIAKSSVATSRIQFQLNAGQAATSITKNNNPANTDILFEAIITATTNNDELLSFNFTSTTTGSETITIKDMFIIDLTQMFGTGNEPTSLSDNRIQKILNSGYIPYNTGTYKGTDISEISSDSYNLFDGETELGAYDINTGSPTNTSAQIRCKNDVEIIGGKSITCEIGSIGGLWGCLLDKNKNILNTSEWSSGLGNAGNFKVLCESSGNHFVNTFNVPNNAKYIRFYFTAGYGTTYLNNVCVHIQGTRTGYAPYQTFTPISLKYQGNGAINSHDTLEITSTEYVFTKNICNVDLGSMTWTLQSNYSANTFETYISDMFSFGQSGQVFNGMLCSKYSVGSNVDTISKDKVIGTYLKYIRIRDTDYTSTADFKTALSGVYLYYQLATPQVIRIPRKHLGVVDLGTLNWSYQSDNQRFLSNDLSSLMKKITDNGELGNLYCSKYQTHTYNGSTGINNIIIQYVSSNINRIFIRDTNYTDANTFKTAMSGIYLFYETQDEVTDIPFTIEVESGGTITTDSEVLPNIEFDIKCK